MEPRIDACGTVQVTGRRSEFVPFSRIVSYLFLHNCETGILNRKYGIKYVENFINEKLIWKGAISGIISSASRKGQGSKRQQYLTGEKHTMYHINPTHIQLTRQRI